MVCYHFHVGEEIFYKIIEQYNLPNIFLLSWEISSGSRNFRGGGGKHEIQAAAFGDNLFYDYFYRLCPPALATGNIYLQMLEVFSDVIDLHDDPLCSEEYVELIDGEGGRRNQSGEV